MKCYNCGAELSDDTKFCSYCGTKIAETTPDPIKSKVTADANAPDDDCAQNDAVLQKQNTARDSHSTQSKTASNIPMAKASLGDNIKSKLLTFWNGQDIFGKISTVTFAVVILLLLVAVCTKKGLPIFFSVIQLAGLVVAVLMHKSVIKLEAKKKWIQYLVFAVAVLFTVLNIMSYSWGQGNSRNTSHSNLSSASDTNEAPDTPAATATTPYGADECIGQDISSMKNEFASAGFTNVKTDKVEDLTPADSDKINTIVSVSIGTKTDFTKGQEFNRNNEVVIRYHAYEKCNIKIHIDFIPNLIFSQYDVNILLNGIEKGELEHGVDKDFEFSVAPGEYTLAFESAASSSVKGEILLTVDCAIEASYKISCYSDKVSVEELYVDRLIELADGEVKLDVSASEYNYKNYEDVAAALETLGFTNIKYEILYDIVVGWTDEGEVKSVNIAGNKDFTRGDVFAADAEIIITYHMPEDDNPTSSTMSTDSSDAENPVSSGPVFYSTNDYETATKGNTGVFSYKSSGSSYDIYWIIDFDDGYVYYFTDGNGDSSCDRLKIESGDLNDKIIITYHDGSDVWSYGLHFKYVNHPETLIMQDNDGFEYKYSTTDLSDALSLKNEKTVKDY